MASFQINKYHQSLLARDANELKKFAQDGTLEPSDLIQPEGSKEWLYAGELPKVGEIVIANSYPEPPVKTNRVLGVLLLLVAIGFFYGAYQYNSQLLSEEDLQLIGNILQEDQAMLTENSKLYKDHEARSTLTTLDKDSIVDLKDKRGDFFQVSAGGKTGWISVHDIAPAYLFAGKDIRYKYDARFNAYRKIFLSSYSWERPVYGSDETLFFLQLQNTTPYTVEGIVLKLEFLDASGELLTIYLDVTLPALHQEAITSRDEIYENARKVKAKAYPRKDSAGRLLTENSCLPFILTSMGGFCAEGHDFLRLCKKRNKGATLHLLDVLVTQHAKWTARRIRRGLFGQALVDFSAETWSSIQLQDSAKQKTSLQEKKQPKKTPRLLRSFAQKRIVTEDTHSLVPGMSLYDDFDMDVGTASAETRSVSFSTTAAANQKVSRESDEDARSQESIDS